MDEGAVVREQQQARRIVIQTPHRLHIAPTELLGQQSQHAWVMTGLARTFKLGRLVQGKINEWAAGPLLAHDGERQPLRVEWFITLSHRPAFNRDIALQDQLPTAVTGPEALALEDSVEA
jgi:hypothetical protein